MIPTNLGLVNHSFIRRGVLFNLFFQSHPQAEPLQIDSVGHHFFHSHLLHRFEKHKEDEQVWTLERAEIILLRWSVLVYCLLLALWFYLIVSLGRRSI